MTMTDEERRFRLGQAIVAEDGEPEGWYWLSFSDTDRPKGQQFLGACVVRARGIATAVREAHVQGCNPGGQVKVVGPAEFEVKPGWANRLLSRAECDEFTRQHAAGRN